MKIEIDVFFHTDSTENLSNLGIDYDIQKCEVRRMTVYNVNAISPYLNTNGMEYCSIHCNGSEFICVESYDTIKQMME